MEMSDEGLMTADIEECLSVVHKALRKSDLPARGSDRMVLSDARQRSSRFIAREPIQSLRNHFQAATAR